MQFRKEVASASGDPKEAFKWITEAENAKSFEELSDSGVFLTLDSKIAAALSKVLEGELGRKVQVIEEKLATEGTMMMGRQMYWLIHIASRPADPTRRRDNC